MRLYSWSSKILFGIIYIHPEELPLAFLLELLMNSLSFSSSENILFCFNSWRIFLLDIEFRFKRFKDIIPFSSALWGFSWEIHSIQILVLYILCFILLYLLAKFFFIFSVQQYYYLSRSDFLYVYTVWSSLSSWMCKYMSLIKFWEVFSNYLLKNYLLHQFLFLFPLDL